VSKLKRRLERMHRCKRASADITSFCEDGCLVTAVLCKGEFCFTLVEGITADVAGLDVLDESIRYLIKGIPWKGKQDLLSIVDAAVDEFIERAEKTVKGS